MLDQLVGAVIPNYPNNVGICLVDLLSFGVLLFVGKLAVVQTTYILNVAKMDGAGFLSSSASSTPSQAAQQRLDGENEAQIMAMLEKDVRCLNDVISAYFDQSHASSRRSPRSCTLHLRWSSF